MRGLVAEVSCRDCWCGCCNPFRGNISEGVQNLGNMHRRCLESEAAFLSCLSATENNSGSFAAPRKTVKALKQRLWPNAGVAGRLAARGFFAARLCVYRTQIPWQWSHGGDGLNVGLRSPLCECLSWFFQKITARSQLCDVCILKMVCSL